MSFASSSATILNDAEFNDYWHKKGQVAFGKAYPDLDFEDIFKINYL